VPSSLIADFLPPNLDQPATSGGCFHLLFPLSLFFSCSPLTLKSSHSFFFGRSCPLAITPFFFLQPPPPKRVPDLFSIPLSNISRPSRLLPIPGELRRFFSLIHGVLPFPPPLLFHLERNKGRAAFLVCSPPPPSLEPLSCAFLFLRQWGLF